MKLVWRWKRAAAGALLSGVVFGLVGCGEKEKQEAAVAPPESRPASGEVDAGEVTGEPGVEQRAVAGEGEPGEAVAGERQRQAPGDSPGEPAGESEQRRTTEPAAGGAPEKPREPWSLAQAGFAARLPPDVDLYVEARNLQWVLDLVEQFKGNEVVRKLILEWMGEPAPLKEYEEMVGELKGVVPQLLKDEVFLAARGVARPAEAALEISEETNKSFGRNLTKALASGSLDDFLMEEFGEAMPKELSRWIKGNLKLLEGRQDLALYVGGRLEEKARGDVREGLAGMMKKAAAETDELEPVEWEAGGAKWSGMEFSGEDVPALQRNSPPEGVDEETWAELRAALRNLSVVVACAEVGEFVVVAAGLGRDAIALVEAPEQSLAASESFQFLAGFEAEAMVATTWVGKRIVNGLAEWNRGLPLLEGIEEGLKAAPNLRRKAEMLQAVGETIAHSKARSAGSAFDHVGVVVRGEEIRYETRGGWMSPGLDLESPLKLNGVLAGLEKGIFLQGSWKMRKEHVERGHKQAEAATRMLRLVAEEVMERLSEGKADDEEMAEKMIRWKRDLAKGIDDLGKGYSDHFAKAFGEEWALVADLRGEMIPAVGVEDEIVKKGRIPRVALVRPVVQREALAEAWKKWHGALTNLFAIVAEAFDQPIPFPDTMTAEKNELRTYFFPFPFASDDFLPSVSVSDDLFILGSSKTLSEKVYASSLETKEEGKEAGLLIEINTEELWQFCEIWLGIHERRLAAKEMFEEEDFEEQREGGDAAEPAPAHEHDHRHLPDGAERDPNQLKEKKAEEEREEKPRREETEESQPGFPGIPEGEIENPLLKELWGEEGEPPGEDSAPAVELEPRVRIDPAREPLQAEIADLPGEEFDPKQFEAGGPLGVLSELPGPEVLRALLEKARWCRTLRYRRWAQDGVPRGSLRIKWAAP